MLLLTGPAGSGKTFQVLEGFREALRRKDPGVRLLVPTATMAQHLQNQVAREGFVFRPGLIQTLSRFVEPWVEELPQVSGPVLYLIVEEAARRVNRPEFARVVRLPGFCASLARTLEEFSAAGCDALCLAQNLQAGSAPLGEAFLAVFAEVERELESRGLGLRSQRLQQASARIEREGLPGIHTVWLDGFYALPDPEFSVIRAIGRHADLTLTLPSGKTTESIRARLLALGFTERVCEHAPVAPAIELCEAPTIEREADEIARRILEQAEGGRAFREMGIIVRNPEAYEPILRAALERFTIPARFYFDAELLGHGVMRFLAGAVDALLGGWDHAATLAVMRLAPELGSSAVMDRLDFAVRERMPGRGLAGLKEIAKAVTTDRGTDRIVRLLDSLGALEEWRSLSLTPEDWAARLKRLRTLFRPPRPAEPATHEMAGIWRSQATALDGFDRALEEAAQLDKLQRVPLSEFWRRVKSVLRLTPLRLDDGRRNVVHVLSAHEARQWELPVVFVCGLVEKQFPLCHRPDPFFPEAARRQLRDAGIRVRTAEEFESEEQRLFDSAVTRATSLLTLSYPRFDSRGEQNLRSLFLDGFAPPATPTRPVRPQPLHRRSGSRPPVAIRSDDLLRLLAERHAGVSPTALESYLQCPFQFFGNQTLRLQPPPARPAERLDALAQGNIVHGVLAEWHRAPQPLAPLFERIFRATCEAKHIPAGYRTELLRERMLEDLEAFASSRRWPRGFETRTEVQFAFPLTDSLAIRGRIDRLDVTRDQRAFVIDYKYSGPQRTKERTQNETLLQAPLYLLAVERAFGLKPAGMFYCGLRGEVRYAGWGHPGAEIEGVEFPPGWLEGAAERSRIAVARIRQGEIAPAPADLGPCAYCGCLDVCRFRGRARALAAEETRP